MAIINKLRGQAYRFTCCLPNRLSVSPKPASFVLDLGEHGGLIGGACHSMPRGPGSGHPATEVTFAVRAILARGGYRSLDYDTSTVSKV